MVITNNMPRNFSTALEARQVLGEIQQSFNNLKYKRELKKLLRNCETLLNNLSNAEVRARQLHKPTLTEEPRQALAEALDQLENWIFIAALSE